MTFLNREENFVSAEKIMINERSSNNTNDNLFYYLGTAESRVQLDAVEVKPEYVRVIAEHMRSNNTEEYHGFALHKRGARFCRLLESMLDADDIECVNFNSSASASNTKQLPTIYLPQATKEGVECLFAYLELVQTRVPSVLSKPLKAPLDELTQPWEMKYILYTCLGLSRQSTDYYKSSEVIVRTIIKRGSSSLDRIIEVAMLSDFFLIEPLRDLTCAFLAFVGLSIPTEKDLLQLCNSDHLLTESELEPLYNQYLFLRQREE